ncbi:MAG: hypothetical protein K0U68_11950 [Gammaproteobacteria bacterium]|nr:hypothetical protein [Gammaproteobacteria bacterium]
MRRVHISLDSIATLGNLFQAYHLAARGKRQRVDVRRFERHLDQRLTQLGEDIRDQRLPFGRYRVFRIHDPKPRLIHAACFEDRVFHHALMNLAGPVLERAMTSTSYACRPGMGVHRSVSKVQQHLKAGGWFVKTDIDGYFANISHQRLLLLLMRRFKGCQCEAQFQRIIQSHVSRPGQGLPIGSLTSQYFANYYLDGLDRLLAAQPEVSASVRYMDDTIWFCRERESARYTLQLVRDWLACERGLTLKTTVQIQPADWGVSWCGYRILPDVVRLSRRKKRRFQQLRQNGERRFLRGEMNACQLQTAYSAVHAMTAHTSSLAWRCKNLSMHPPLEI